MRRFKLGFALSALLASLMFCLTVHGDTPATNQASLVDEHARLKARVEALERQVQELTRALKDKDLELDKLKRFELLQRDGANRPLDARWPRLVEPAMPPGSSPFQFNGVTYYYVPLSR
jgi:hypothetical protein